MFELLKAQDNSFIKIHYVLFLFCFVVNQIWRLITALCRHIKFLDSFYIILYSYVTHVLKTNQTTSSHLGWLSSQKSIYTNIHPKNIQSFWTVGQAKRNSVTKIRTYLCRYLPNQFPVFNPKNITRKVIISFRALEIRPKRHGMVKPVWHRHPPT